MAIKILSPCLTRPLDDMHITPVLRMSLLLLWGNVFIKFRHLNKIQAKTDTDMVSKSENKQLIPFPSQDLVE